MSLMGLEIGPTGLEPPAGARKMRTNVKIRNTRDVVKSNRSNLRIIFIFRGIANTN